MNISASTKLESYLNAFRQRIKLLTIVQGSAVVALVLLSVSTLGAWFAIDSGYATDTIIIFRILLILALAAAFIKFISLPLRQIKKSIGTTLETRTANSDGKGFEGRIETYLQMNDKANPFRELLAENALDVSTRYPEKYQVKVKEFSIASSITALCIGIFIYLLIAGPSMLNYSLRHLLAGWAVNDLLPPQSIVVTPGDQSVRRGANVRITTTMTGFNSDEAILHVQNANNDWQEVAMVDGPNGFEFTFFSMQEPMSYYVSTFGLRSPEFDIQVVDLPSIENLSLVYTYPDWSERDPETFSQGDIRTLPDTQVALTVTTSAPLPAGQLVLNSATQSLLLDGNQASTEFTVTKEGDYYIAAIVGGEQVRLSDDYFIRLTEDAKPVLQFSQPGEDYNASNIEEVLVRMDASDDYGLNSLVLKYAINGGDWEVVELSDESRNISVEHLFMLEDTPLVPGDLISYYGEVSDRSQTVRTDMFFIQIQPFNRRYTQSQLSGGGGGGGGGAQQDEISQRQRQIIVSTWNLLREQTEDEDNKQIELKSSLLSDLQTTLAEQAQTLAERTRARQLNQDDEIASFVQSMELAIEAMYPASEKLAFVELEDAIQPAQEALRHLLHAESVFNDITVTQQQGGGGGGGGGASQDLAEMFELEMDMEKNQYETGDSASPQAQQQEDEDIMSQLDELARRQEQLANNMAQQQQVSEAQRYQQEMLRREAQELQEQLDRRQEQRQSNQQNQQQVNNQSSQDSPSESQQQGGQQGSQGESGQGEQVAQQSELQRRLESAIRAMDDASAAMNGNSSQEQRQTAAAEAQRQLEGARSQVAQEQLDSMQGSFSEMATKAERMLRDQQRMGERLQQAMITAVEERESGENPDSRGMGLQEEWSLARQKQNLATELQNLQQQMLSSIQSFDDQAPNATRELQRANAELNESELEQALADAALYIDSGYGLYIAGNESNVTAAMRNLSDSLTEAQQMATGAAAPGDSALDRAQRQAQDLRSQLQQQAQNQQGQEGQGQQGQTQEGEGQQGQGQQPGQSGGGQQGGARFGSGGAWASGDDLFNGPIELPTGFFDNIDNLSQLARAAIPQLDLNTEQLAQMMDLIRELEYSRINRNDAIIAQELNAMLALIEQLEASLQISNRQDNPNNVRAAVADVIPEEYQDSVAEYYRRLSTD